MGSGASGGGRLGGRTALRQRRAGIVVRQNRRIAVPFEREHLRPVLAHPHAVTVALGNKLDAPRALRDGEAGAAQAAERAQLVAADGDPAHGDAFDKAAAGAVKAAEPVQSVGIERSRRIAGEKHLPKFVGIEHRRVGIARQPGFALGRGDADEVRHVAAPDVGAVVGFRARHGMKHGHNRLALIGEDLPRRVGDGFGDAVGVAPPVFAPAGGERVEVGQRAAVRRIVADDRAGVRGHGVRQAVGDIRPRGYGLRFQRLLGEKRGHFSGDDGLRRFLDGHLRLGAVEQDGDVGRAVGPVGLRRLEGGSRGRRPGACGRGGLRGRLRGGLFRQAGLKRRAAVRLAVRPAGKGRQGQGERREQKAQGQDDTPFHSCLSSVKSIKSCRRGGAFVADAT